MVGPEGHVTGIDHPELVELARRNISKSWQPLLEGPDPRITLLAGDGWHGAPGAVSFAAIHVGAAATSVPQKLLAQLDVGGRLVIPIGPADSEQWLHVIDFQPDGTFLDQKTLVVRYVQLEPSDAMPVAPSSAS